jgi:hypothetical protein
MIPSLQTRIKDDRTDAGAANHITAGSPTVPVDVSSTSISAVTLTYTAVDVGRVLVLVSRIPGKARGRKRPKHAEKRGNLCKYTHDSILL